MTTQRLQLAFIDHDVITQHANRLAAHDVAVGHQTTGNRAELGRAEHIAHFGQTNDLFAYFRTQQAADRVGDVLNRFVDDAVIAYVHTRFLDNLARLGVGTDVEADDNRLRRQRQLDIGLADTAYTAGNDADLDLFRGNLAERLDQRFHTALHVALDEQIQILRFRRAVFADRREHLFQTCGLLLGELVLAFAFVALTGDFLGALLVGYHEGVIAGFRRAGQAEHLDRNRRASRFHLLAQFVEHGAHTPEMRAGQNGVAALERTGLDQNRRDRTTPLLEAGFDHRTAGRHVDRRLELGHFGLEQNGVQQIVDTFTGMRGHRHDHGVAAPIFRNDVFGRQAAFHLVDIRGLYVHLGDRDHHRHARGARVLNRFLRLRHHTVIRSHDKNRDIGDFGAAGTHAGKRCVARRIDEGNRALVVLHVVGADMLGDTTRFTGLDLGATNIIEQRCLAMVDVTHDGHHRGTRHAFDFVFLGAHFVDQRFFRRFRLDRLGIVAHLLDQKMCRILIDGLVDGGHHTQLHHPLEQITAFDGHALSQFGHGDELRNLDVAYDRCSRTLETVVGRDIDLATATRNALLLALATAFLAFGDVELLALAAIFLAIHIFLRAAVVLGGTTQVFLSTRTRVVHLDRALGALFIERFTIGFFFRLTLRIDLGFALGAFLGLLAQYFFLLALGCSLGLCTLGFFDTRLFGRFLSDTILLCLFSLGPRLLLGIRLRRLGRLFGLGFRLRLLLLAVGVGATFAHFDAHRPAGRCAAARIHFQL